MAGGTGLGLSIVQGIVQAHDGRIWESRYGEGSSFHVSVAAGCCWRGVWDGGSGGQVGEDSDGLSRLLSSTTRRGERAAAFKVIQFDTGRRLQIAREPSQRLSVLVVDDEPDVITFTREMLKDEYEIFSAETSATAIREAISRKPDLVLLDAWMPGIIRL